jgi:hypothetical protein
MKKVVAQIDAVLHLEDGGVVSAKQLPFLSSLLHMGSRSTLTSSHRARNETDFYFWQMLKRQGF